MVSSLAAEGDESASGDCEAVASHIDTVSPAPWLDRRPKRTPSSRPMTAAHALILHHYDPSPFSEKVRLVLGLKRLAWRSVIQPMVLPKPELMPLTGGNRRTPVLQIGADVFCGTNLIAEELERRFPRPTIHPEDSKGLAEMVSLWADEVLFLDGGVVVEHGPPTELLAAPREERTRRLLHSIIDPL